jgi:hypothetical protein
MKDHIIEGNSLFLLDFKKDLGLEFKSGQIAINYKFVQKGIPDCEQSAPLTELTGVAAFTFNEKTKFLLNFYNHQHHGQHWESANKEGIMSPQKRKLSSKDLKGESSEGTTALSSDS